MNKHEFLQKLETLLAGLSPKEKEERITVYREMIEDRMEDGLSEEEAVLAVGSADDIAMQFQGELPSAPNTPKRRLKGWETTLLILGSPIWLALLICVAAVVFSAFVSLWAGIISLWAGFAATVSCVFALLIVGVIFLFGEHWLTGIAMIGGGLVCAGLGIFLFFGCKILTKGMILLTKKTVGWVKQCFTRKEVA